MTLPNIANIAAVSKCKRKKRDVLTSCYESIIYI